MPAVTQGVLEGDLWLRGSGDPRLVIEDLWLLVQRIRGSGVREIRGDLVLDRSAHEPMGHDPAAFDGEALRPYNAGPDALLLNYKAVSFHFVPDMGTRQVRVYALPAEFAAAGARIELVDGDGAGEDYARREGGMVPSVVVVVDDDDDDAATLLLPAVPSSIGGYMIA